MGRGARTTLKDSRIGQAGPDLYTFQLSFLAGTVVKLTYGVHEKSRVEYYMNLLVEGIERAIQAAIPGAYLVDIFPIMKYIPEWVPGAGFQTEARETRDLARRFGDEPMEEALRQMVRTC